MQTLKIKTYRTTDEFQNQNHFFILSKGNNSGKPLLDPCRNCFVITTNNLEEREYFYWLCYGLWAGGFFRPYLTGSVFSFIRVTELYQVINTAHSKVRIRREALKNSIEVLNKLSTHSENLEKQIELIKQAKRAVLYKLFR